MAKPAMSSWDVSRLYDTHLQQDMDLQEIAHNLSQVWMDSQVLNVCIGYARVK
jgi:hypothetical protein